MNPVSRWYRMALGPSWSPVSLDRLRVAATGRVVLVTGASSGIGEQTAELLGAAGATVLLTARRGELLVALAERIAARGGRAVPYAADLADPEAVDELAARILADHDRIDVIVSNAGKSIRRSLTDTADRFHDVTRSNAVNFLGPVRLLSALLPRMRARRSGQLVNVSSLSVDLPAANFAVYGATKSAFEAWLRGVAPELRADGVATTSIHLPLVHTAMSAPTYGARLPGLTARQAAEVVARTLVTRPRLLVPWWVRLAGVLTSNAQGPYEAASAALLRRRR